MIHNQCLYPVLLAPVFTPPNFRFRSSQYIPRNSSKRRLSCLTIFVWSFPHTSCFTLRLFDRKNVQYIVHFVNVLFLYIIILYCIYSDSPNPEKKNNNKKKTSDLCSHRYFSMNIATNRIVHIYARA